MHVPWCYFSKSHGYQVEGDLASTGTGRPDRVAGAPDPPFAAGESLRGMQSWLRTARVLQVTEGGHCS